MWFNMATNETFIESEPAEDADVQDIAKGVSALAPFTKPKTTPVSPNIAISFPPSPIASDTGSHIIDRSNREIKQGVRNMIRTKAFRRVTEKLRKGSSWSIISGSPGEGKNTMAYFIMKYLMEKEYDVYVIKSKEEYFSIKEFGPRTAIMISNIFGKFTFDEAELNYWLLVLGDLEQVTQRRNDSDEDSLTFQVVLTTRNYILKAAFPHLDRYSPLFQDPSHVTDLSVEEPLTYEDKMYILRSHLGNTSLGQTTFERICQLPTVHGFPLCCRLLSKLTEFHNEPLNFFSYPLTFLGYTTLKLMENEKIRNLFCALSKNNGMIKLETENMTWDDTYKHLVDCYLTSANGYLNFSHPSILWSVVSTIAQSNPKFVIRECPIHIIRELIAIENNSCSPSHHNKSKVTIDTDCEEVLLERFVTECESGYLYSVLTHQAFSSVKFTQQFFQNLRSKYTVDMIASFKDIITRKTFLQLAASNKSAVLLKFICKLMSFNGDQQKYALFGCCEDGSTEAFSLLIRLYPLMNFKIRDNFNRSALSLASKCGNVEVVRLLLQFSDINDADDFGMNALHCSLDSGNAGVAVVLVEHGLDVNTPDIVGRSPLHYASWNGLPDVVHFLLDKGAVLDVTDRDGAIPLHDACYRGYTQVADLLIKAGSDVNAVNLWGESPLHIACCHANKAVVRCLLRSRCDLSLKSLNGKSAEDVAQKYGHVEIVEMLQDHQRRKMRDPSMSTAQGGVSN